MTIKIATANQNISETHKELLTSLSEGIIPAEAKVIYKGRNIVYTIHDNGRYINIKAFKKPSFPNNYVYTTFRKSKACRSFENAQRLIELGVNTPLPIAYIEIKECGKLTLSYYLSEQMDNLQTVRDWSKFDFTDQLLDNLAVFMKELTDKHIYHRDFSPGNILFEKTDDDKFTFYLVDLNRMEFEITDSDKMNRMFRAITTNLAENQDLAHRFALTTGLDINQTQQMAARQLQNYINEKKRNGKIKKIFKIKPSLKPQNLV
ncbi:MAG: lipopolysaccharide kinase InaA family protein [Muribaculaceae bacterium]|nr:lipopolysaccharide kinase InaA family protein [Muribaculaceae bacterium]